MPSRFNALPPAQFADHVDRAANAIKLACQALDHAATHGAQDMVQQLERIDGQDDLSGIALRLSLLANRIRANEVAA